MTNSPTTQERKPCDLCSFELWLLDATSPFAEENIDMYEESLGKSWTEIGGDYGYSPNTAAEIVEDIHRWLDEHSPYRNRKMRSEYVDPHPGCSER